MQDTQLAPLEKKAAVSFDVVFYTTVIISEVPSCLAQDALLARFDERMADFFYCPWNARTSENLGYAVMNFFTHAGAEKFLHTWDNRSLPEGGPLHVRPWALQGTAVIGRHFARLKLTQNAPPWFGPLVCGAQGEPLMPMALDVNEVRIDTGHPEQILRSTAASNKHDSGQLASEGKLSVVPVNQGVAVDGSPTPLFRAVQQIHKPHPYPQQRLQGCQQNQVQSDQVVSQCAQLHETSSMPVDRWGSMQHPQKAEVPSHREVEADISTGVSSCRSSARDVSEGATDEENLEKETVWNSSHWEPTVPLGLGRHSSRNNGESKADNVFHAKNGRGVATKAMMEASVCASAECQCWSQSTVGAAVAIQHNAEVWTSIPPPQSDIATDGVVAACKYEVRFCQFCGGSWVKGASFCKDCGKAAMLAMLHSI
eukprot:gnl/TRDRNA2_/TRDRNA2_173606_c3_seq1.p1 gnl/TRDRNA2_/TRDRNA2_173606_c3~~gnl/TRDRNA2_/TRDRNA2_173606_c3_seq1.p1  ORF type:complete len:459 (-),score=55.21 gnl/TRDRNA2_/TRDRNA2_173606_c3_seq1:117-1394(-)